MKTLRELRTALGLTQKELSDYFNVSDRTIYQIEKESSNIKDSLLKKYMLAFNIDYDDIFLGTEYEIFVFENSKVELFKDRTQKIKQEA